ncbi:SGNH/GDSL hydrolase family protein [Pacificibacter marinus]|nr:SGNH/GDSL hydrolase family protein [Pacificibacter marinus]
MRSLLLSLSVLIAGVCIPHVAQSQSESQTLQAESKILAIGDSLMAWHSASGASIAHVVGQALNEPVLNRAIGGAKIIHALPVTGALGFKISAQFSSGQNATPKDWVIMTGGGNDLFLGCGCNKCERRIQRMIDPKGQSGEIPKLIAKIRQTGARVVYVGYLRSPGVDSVIDACLPFGNEFEARIATMAEGDDGVFFVSLEGLTQNGDRSMHGVDMIHPSRKASNLIGQRVADVIRKADKTR